MTDTPLPGMGVAGSGAPAHLADRVQKCRSCGAPILWALTNKSKTMPVDVAPNADGNVHLHLDGGTLRAVVGQPPLGGPCTIHHSHFATCPHAAEHRKGRR